MTTRRSTSETRHSTDEIEVVVVVGTRPEIIKTAPILRAMDAANEITPHVVHTNQHYDRELSDVFFEVLRLSPPDTTLEVRSGSHAEQTAAGMTGIERLLTDRDPDLVLAQGDTNTVVSTALAASKLPVAFGHVEAGLRSDDRSMPEEINRIVADHVADYCFAPTEAAAANLAAEGLTEGVLVTGNTVVDACLEHQPIAEEVSTVLNTLAVHPSEYGVATIHRPQNTNDLDRLRRILVSLDRQGFPVVFPAHPRTVAKIDELGFEPSRSLQLVSPLDYLDFLELLANARVVVTDSGGIQEEASILQIPCLTVRPNTERPETIAAGVNELLDPGDVEARLATVYDADAVHDSMTGHTHLYGDGSAGERIVTHVLREFEATTDSRPSSPASTAPR